MHILPQKMSRIGSYFFNGQTQLLAQHILHNDNENYYPISFSDTSLS